VRKFVRNFEDYGWKTTLRKTGALLLSPVYKHCVYRLYRADLDRIPVWPQYVEATMPFRYLTPRDTAAIKQIEDRAEWMHGAVSRRLAGGSLCLAVFDGETLAGFNLVSFGKVEIPLISMEKTFRENACWSDHIAVRKDYRQRGLATELRYRVFRELRARGIRYFYGGTLPDNIASLSLVRRVGFSEFVDVSYENILGVKTWRYRRLRSKGLTRHEDLAAVS